MTRRGAWGRVGMALAAVVAAGGCGRSERQRRTHDAAPVVVVTAPTRADAGQGPAADEVEPNDGAEVATALPPGGTARGRIEPATDVDVYAIDVAEAGALAVELGGVEGVDLTLEITEPGGAVLARSERGGARIREGVPNLGVAPGRYLAVVRARPAPAPKGKRAGKKAGAAPVDAGAPAAPAPVYELTAQLAAPPAGAERERNDDRGTAGELILGETVSGLVGWAGDADVWKLSVEALSEKNAIDVEVSPVEGVALTLELADGVGAVLATRKAPRGAGAVLRGLVPVLPAGAPPFHYVTVKGDRSNPETAYQLRVAAKVPGPDAEIEPNDAPASAMAVPADRTVVHATWSPGDVDCFALPAADAPRTLAVLVDTPADADLSAELLVDGKVVASSAQPGKGAAEKVSGAVPAGVTAVLRVQGSARASDKAPPAAAGAGEGGYDIRIEEGPPPAP